MPHITQKSKYWLLLLTLVGFILISPLTLDTWFGRSASALLFLFVVFEVTSNIKSAGHSRWIIPTFGTVAVVCNFAGESSFTFTLIGKLAGIVFFSNSIFLFGKNVFADYHLNIDRIYGSICVYLLIGMAYAYLYMVLQLFIPLSLSYQGTGIPLTNTLDYYYFSYMTLTTVGFGDIIPTNDFSKAIIMIESITGLFYLAVLVASLTNVLKTLGLKRK
tara:strand:+ start:1887 stop:2540 length:654 start_codon:yes stop_codon:yes gene_type:complete